MQLTRLDRWLREKFVMETHIYSLRPPEYVPAGIATRKMPEKASTQYRHHYVARDHKAAQLLIETFKQNNQMYTTRVAHRKTWYSAFLTNDQRSVTWWFVWLLIIICGVFVFIHLVNLLQQNPTFQENLKESLEILKG